MFDLFIFEALPTAAGVVGALAKLVLFKPPQEFENSEGLVSEKVIQRLEKSRIAGYPGLG